MFKASACSSVVLGRVGLLAACLVGVVLLENTYVLLACRFVDGTRGVVIPV